MAVTIEITISDADFLALDEACNTVETKLGAVRTIEAGERRKFARLGQKTVGFAYRLVETAKRNMSHVPRGIDLEELSADMRMWENLRYRGDRFRQIAERVEDTSLLLGSSILSRVLLVYRSLRANGSGAGLETILGELGQRWGLGRTVAEEEEEGSGATPVALKEAVADTLQKGKRKAKTAAAKSAVAAEADSAAGAAEAGVPAEAAG